VVPDPATRSKPRILEWFRADPWPRMRRVLLLGPTVLTIGGLVIAVSFLTHQPEEVRIESAAAGFVLIAGGAVFTLAAMHRILRQEVSLVVRTDGVALQSAQSETLVPWAQLRDARWDAARTELVLDLEQGEPLAVARMFTPAQGPRVVESILQSKRRAAMNLPQ
jgi:hypothetical protein